MKNKLLIILVCLLSANTVFFLLNGCRSCGPMLCGYYNNATLLAVDNADSFAHLPSGDGVIAKAFLLVLTLDDTSYKCVQQTTLFPTNTAYAECIRSRRLIEIDSLSLISDHNFDPLHPAGTDLKDLFSRKDSGFVHPGRNNLFLLHAPSDTGTHTFTIKLFAHDTTRNLTATSIPVKLLL